MKKILIYQTAFLGDVILTLPLVQSIKKQLPNVLIDFVTTPMGFEIVKTHNDLNKIIIFDKRKNNSGIIELIKLSQSLKKENYDVVISPHRSFRTSLLLYFSRIKKRISFDISSFNKLYTQLIKYEKNIHEVDRNLKLLSGIGLEIPEEEFPTINILLTQKEKVDSFCKENNLSEKIITIASGSVWKTKKWPLNYYEKLILLLSEKYKNYSILIIGGEEEFKNGNILKDKLSISNLIIAAGSLSLIESAELIHRSEILITNDTAPLHLATAMKTKIVAIFGPTVLSFGFGPYGKNNLVIENNNLNCRPCSTHGGDECPIKTFECMMSLTPEIVFQNIQNILK